MNSADLVLKFSCGCTEASSLESLEPRGCLIRLAKELSQGSRTDARASCLSRLALDRSLARKLADKSPEFQDPDSSAPPAASKPHPEKN